MSEYDELWEFLHKCNFKWECVADDSIYGNVRKVRIVFEVQQGEDDGGEHE
jgi:hypothetical protein